MQYVSQSCAESKQMSALRSLKLCNILPTANRKKPVQGSPLAKTVTVGADFAGRFVSHANLDQSANRFNFPAVPRWAPQGNQNHIGFCRGCHCSTVTQPEEILFRTAFGSPHRKPLCYYNMPGDCNGSNLKSQARPTFCNRKRSESHSNVKEIEDKNQSIATKRSLRPFSVQKVCSVEPA